MDGGLRTLPETKNFPALLKRTKREVPLAVVYLDIPEEVAIERLAKGANARKREGDSLEGIKVRLSFPHKQLKERLDFIRKQKGWRLIKIDATGTIEEIFNHVYQMLTSSP